jgi:hypothetical protein
MFDPPTDLDSLIHKMPSAADARSVIDRTAAAVRDAATGVVDRAVSLKEQFVGVLDKSSVSLRADGQVVTLGFDKLRPVFTRGDTSVQAAAPRPARPATAARAAVPRSRSTQKRSAR